MKIADILALLRVRAPEETAESWDNPGLLVDSGREETDAVLVTLDITPAAVEQAKALGAGLLVSHHPVIFRPVSCLDAADIPYRLAAAGITAFAAHTNLDKAAGGVNDVLAARLGLERVQTAPDGMCRVGELAEPLEARAFAERAAARLGTAVRFAGSGPVRRVGVCGGAGGDMWPALPGIDAFVTGEVKHHEWLDAARAGLTLVDAGHYATEVLVVDTLCGWLREGFPGLQVEAFTGAAPYETLAVPGRA